MRGSKFLKLKIHFQSFLKTFLQLFLYSIPKFHFSFNFYNVKAKLKYKKDLDFVARIFVITLEPRISINFFVVFAVSYLNLVNFEKFD